MKKLSNKLNCQERKELKKEFLKTKFGKSQNIIYKRLLINSLLLFIFGLFLLIEALFFKKTIYAYLSCIIIFFFSITFFIGRYYAFKKNLNNYLIKRKK